MLVEIAFKGNRKEFFHWEAEEALPARAPVIVEADHLCTISITYNKPSKGRGAMERTTEQRSP